MSKKRNTCAALSAAGTECSRPPLDSVQWCPRHNEVWSIETRASVHLTDGADFNPQERLKLYASYKAHGALLKAYPCIPACHDVATIMRCHSISTLREWNAHLRGNYNLLTRCIEARDCFTRRFFGEDMDFGHKAFWDGLVRKRTEIEKLMLHVETRGYQLILRDQDALWVLEKDTHETGGCSGDHAHDSDEPFHFTDGAEDAAIPIADPLEAVLRERAIEFREKIRIHLAWYSADSTSQFYDERLEVIWACVRRAIYKDASLMFLSHSYGSVMALLNDQDLDLITVEKIWHAICALCIHDVQSAVDDVVRSTDGDHVVVLGGKVFKDDSDERWPLHAWSHMMAVRHCYTCLRTICLTINEIIDLTRCAWLTRASLGQSYPKYSFDFDGSRELIVAGFIFNNIPLSLPPRHSIICKDSGSPSAGPLWEETRRNLYLSGGLSLDDPKAQAFANACIRHPDFMVMLRKGEYARVIRSPPLVWISRTRRARSPSELASIPWEKTDVVCLSESALENAQPLGGYGERIADCLQVVIVDASQDTMADLIRKLVKIWCQVYNVGDSIELFNAIDAPYEAAGELEDFKYVKGKIALDRYENLWGCVPSPALVEHPERFRPILRWCY